jgi:magnesium-transporting ATPase (P-type)
METGAHPSSALPNSGIVRVSVDIQSRTSTELERRKSRSDFQTPASNQHPAPAASAASDVAAMSEQRKREAAIKAADVVAHKYSKSELTSLLRTDLDRGLSALESKSKLHKDGLNMLTPPKETPWYIKLLLQMVGGFQLMMLGGSILCFIVGPISEPVDFQTVYLGVVLIIVVITTGLFVFYQESKSDSVMAGFKALTPSICNVLRDGQLIQIDAKELVVGDICLVNGGEKVHICRSELSACFVASLTSLRTGSRRLPHFGIRQSQGF